MSLFPTKCRCGKSTMNFKKNIGDFYIDTCCQIAGYDNFGNLKKDDQSQELAGLGEKTEPKVETAPAPVEKKKRTYNRSGNVKPQS